MNISKNPDVTENNSSDKANTKVCETAVFITLKIKESWRIRFAQVRKHASEGTHPVFETQADITRSPKQGYQWSHKKNSCTKKKF